MTSSSSQGPKPPQQLSLGVSLDDDATFENFYITPGSANAQIVATVRQQLQAASVEGADKTFGSDEPFIFVWGVAGVGLTHMLQAVCHEAEGLGLSIQYLPLRDMVGFAPEHLLDGLEALDMVCIDGLQFVAGNSAWEQALFSFFNRMRDAGKRLLIAADMGPKELPIQLPDLQSRLNWGVTFHLQLLDDAEKQAALQLRAKARGLELGDEVAQFILHRAPRNMNELFCYLNRLDDASLAEQRKLTIPFVKQVLGL